MKRVLLISAISVPLLCSCDHIDAVGDKVNELMNARKESTQGVEGMDLNTMINGGQAVDPAVQDIGEVDFQTFISEPGKINIVDFHADWYEPCRNLEPVLSGVVKAHPSVARLGKLNVDHARELTQEQGVSSIPDVRFYIDGILVYKFTGGRPKETIESLIATHSASLQPATGVSGGASATPPDLAGGNAKSATLSSPSRGSNAKPLEETMKPMSKDWLPPGMTRK